MNFIEKNIEKNNNHGAHHQFGGARIFEQKRYLIEDKPHQSDI